MDPVVKASPFLDHDARFTEDQIRGMSADYTMGLNEAGNVQIKISFIESADRHTSAPLTVNPEAVSVVDESICLELARADDAAFFRVSVQQPRTVAPCFLHRDAGGQRQSGGLVAA